jgi:hypothetical protein
MSTFLEHHECLGVSPQLQAPDEVIKRIRKLRWIGMDDEARALEHTLTRLCAAGPVFALPHETD